jgi:hypothetical protein
VIAVLLTKRARALSVIVIGTLCVFASVWRQISTARFFNCDTYSQHLPYLAFFKHSVLQGVFPLWNPYQAAGIPFFGEKELGFLYLPVWLAQDQEYPWATIMLGLTMKENPYGSSTQWPTHKKVYRHIGLTILKPDLVWLLVSPD